MAIANKNSEDLFQKVKRLSVWRAG